MKGSGAMLGGCGNSLTERIPAVSETMTFGAEARTIWVQQQ